jgi:hypothetical protein
MENIRENSQPKKEKNDKNNRMTRERMQMTRTTMLMT